MPDRLVAWSPSTDTALSTYDWGHLPAGSAADTSLRVKNLSTVYTARDVTTNIWYSSGTGQYQFTVSLDGLVFVNTLHLGDIPPTAVVGPITVRRATPSTLAAGYGLCYLDLQPASWS